MIKSVKIEAVKHGETKTGNTKGKDWVLYPIGIKSNGNWSNGAVFNLEDKEKFQEGAELVLQLLFLRF